MYLSDFRHTTCPVNNHFITDIHMPMSGHWLTLTEYTQTPKMEPFPA